MALGVPSRSAQIVRFWGRLCRFAVTCLARCQTAGSRERRLMQWSKNGEESRSLLLT